MLNICTRWPGREVDHLRTFNVFTPPVCYGIYRHTTSLLLGFMLSKFFPLFFYNSGIVLKEYYDGIL
jgi:hypothetical protein